MGATFRYGGRVVSPSQRITISLTRSSLEVCPVVCGLGSGLRRVVAEPIISEHRGKDVELAVRDRPGERIGFAPHAVGHVHGTGTAELWGILVGVRFEEFAVSSTCEAISNAIPRILELRRAGPWLAVGEIGHRIVAF